MVRRYKKKPEDLTKIAKARISILLGKADDVFGSNRSLANRYVTLARKIAMKFKIRLPPLLKRKFCPHCYKFLRPGVNLRVRLQNSKLVYLCLECKKFYRMPYLKEIKAKRKTKKTRFIRPLHP